MSKTHHPADAAAPTPATAAQIATFPVAKVLFEVGLTCAQIASGRIKVNGPQRGKSDQSSEVRAWFTNLAKLCGNPANAHGVCMLLGNIQGALKNGHVSFSGDTRVIPLHNRLSQLHLTHSPKKRRRSQLAEAPRLDASRVAQEASADAPA